MLKPSDIASPSSEKWLWHQKMNKIFFFCHSESFLIKLSLACLTTINIQAYANSSASHRSLSGYICSQKMNEIAVLSKIFFMNFFGLKEFNSYARTKQDWRETSIFHFSQNFLITEINHSCRGLFWVIRFTGLSFWSCELPP